MIRLSVLYPQTEGAKFDHDYYRNHHIPMAAKAFGAEAEIDRGLDGPYVAAAHFRFASQDALTAAMGSSDTAAVLADVPNYTTITPVLQTSEIVD
ncbi:MAG: EthD family reductase [Acidimicrobiaceae bacterium]|nr:EthD family reductase [Acidimicrobiaceae bacterium]